MVKKQTSNLISKLIFWAIELLGAVSIWVNVSIGFGIFSNEDIVYGAFYIVCSLYLISGIVNFVVWLFNSLHKFNDFDGFKDMLAGLSVAPLLLVKHIVLHFLRILGQLFGFETSKSNNKQPNNTSNTSNISTSCKPNNSTSSTEYTITKKGFQYKVEQAAKRIACSTQPDNYIYHGVYTKWWSYPKVRVIWGYVTVTGTVVFECNTPEGDVEDWVTDECADNLIKEIENGILEEINSLASSYQINCGEWEVSVEITCKIA